MLRMAALCLMTVLVLQCLCMAMAFPSRLSEQHRQIANALMSGQDAYPVSFQRHDRDLLSALADRWEMNGINGIHDMTESKRSGEPMAKPKYMMLMPKAYDY